MYTFQVCEIVEMGGRQNAAATVVLELKPCPIPGLIFSFPDNKISRVWACEASFKSARLQSGHVFPHATFDVFVGLHLSLPYFPP